MGGLTDGERAKILGLNAARLFNFEVRPRTLGQAGAAPAQSGDST